jgi:DNA-directed RNA polymerase subunit M/transcription elongation factor TFIIS
MFQIPPEHDIDIINDEQKKALSNSITTYVNYYISDNRLPIKLKESIQLDKYLDIKYNLTNSETLLSSINLGKIDINKLPWMEPHLLDDKLWRIHIDKRDKNRETMDKMATINIFKCSKCKEMKCTTYQLQTASIDEPMTTYIKCKVCGHSWKV